MRKLLFFFLIFLMSKQFSFAIWEPINNGLFSGTFRCFVVKDNRIFAGATDYPVVFSSDNGLSWRLAGDSIINTRGLATIGNKFFAGTWGQGILVSTDECRTWIASNTGLINLYVVSVFVKNDTILAGTWGDGVFISTDSGATWVQTNLKYVRPYAIAGNDFQIFAATDKGLFVSTDNGLTWNNTKIKDIEIYSVSVDSDFVVIGASGAIYYSLDFGENWVRRQIPLVTVQGLEIEGNYVFAATNRGLYISADKGNTWTLKSKNEIFENAFSVLFREGNLIVGTYEKGIFLSSDFGNTWYQVGGDIGYEIYSITSEGSKLFIGTNKGILTASNYGEYWFPTNATLKKVNVVHSCNSYVFAGVVNAILFTTDLGVTWNEASLGSNSVRNVTAISCNSDNVYASGSGAFYAYSKFPVKDFIVDAFFFPLNTFILIDQEMYIGNNNGVAKFLTKQNIIIPLGLDGKNVYCLHHADGKLFAGTNDGFYVSTDYGETWDKKSNGMHDTRVFSVATWKNVYFAGTFIGLYVSTDYGEKWSFAEDEIGYTLVNSIHIGYPYVYVATMVHGVWRARLDDFLASVEIKQSSDDILLRPNPAPNQIQIVLPEGFELAGFDIVSNLGISQRNAVTDNLTSRNSVSVDVSNLPKGTYFAKVVTTCGKVFVKKFIKY